MKAIIIATGTARNNETEFEAYPRELLPLVDRPFIQSVIENLVEQGITEFDFILSQYAERFKNLLGNGSHWGGKFTFHPAKEASRPYRLLKLLAKDEKSILLVQADRLLTAGINLPGENENAEPQIYYWRDQANINAVENRWTGYAVLTERLLTGMTNFTNDMELENYLMGEKSHQNALVETEKPLSVLSYEELIASQSYILLKRPRFANFSAREITKGVWIAENVSLHPSAKIIAPVFIGENSCIGEFSAIGPNATIGNNCLVNKNCSVENSVVAAGSFLDASLHFSNSVVLKNKIVSSKLKMKNIVSDKFISGNFSTTN